MRLVLASASPRRYEIMNLMGFKFEIITKEHEEKIHNELNNYEKCLSIAVDKSKMVYDMLKEDNIIVIGCDTVIIYDDEIIGKPKDYEDAMNLLKKIQDNYHEAVTGVSIMVRKNGKEFVDNFYEVSKVHIDKMSEEEIRNWIESGEAYDKAGGYGIQTTFGKYIDKIEGDYYNIEGLPLNRVYRVIKKYL